MKEKNKKKKATLNAHLLILYLFACTFRKKVMIIISKCLKMIYVFIDTVSRLCYIWEKNVFGWGCGAYCFTGLVPNVGARRNCPPLV